MGDSAKKALSERDICTKYITPALVAANKWDQSQIREEVSFTKGRVLIRGKKSTRGDAKRADFVLSYKPGIRLAVIEAKDAAVERLEIKDRERLAREAQAKADAIGVKVFDLKALNLSPPLNKRNQNVIRNG